VGEPPSASAVMAINVTSSMPLGHVAMLSDSMLRADNANWHRYQIILGMAVIFVSGNKD